MNPLLTRPVNRPVLRIASAPARSGFSTAQRSPIGPPQSCTTTTAAAVDPRWDIGPYLELARYVGVEIEHVLETHNHADHVSGHGRLAAATGATIHVHRDAAVEYDHEPFDDGYELELGSVRVRA